MENVKDVTKSLVEYALDTKYENLTPEIIEKVKMLILDAFGCCIAGSSAIGVEQIINLLIKWNGEKESTVLVYGHKIPAPFAAFANSVMIHARDFEDTHDTAVIHCTTPVLPAVLAMAESEKTNGKDFITAVTLGIEILCRTGLASPRPQLKGWWHTTTLGCFASAIAVGKILRLGAEEMSNAAGISYSQFAGNNQCLEERTLTKRIQPAFASKAGVFSAVLAKHGITGPKNILEGKYGFYNLYLDGKYDRNTILNGLGNTFEMLNLSMKYYPSCRATSGSIDLALGLLRENAINADRINQILVYVTPLTNLLAGKPYEIGDTPQVDAQFSIPYTVATAFLKKDVFIDDFEDRFVRDTKRLNLAKKVKVLVSPDSKENNSFLPLKMEVKMEDGLVYRKEANTLKGSPQNPMNKEDCIEKFHKCTKFAVNQVAKEKYENVVRMIDSLEGLDDVNILIQPLRDT